MLLAVVCGRVMPGVRRFVYERGLFPLSAQIIKTQRYQFEVDALEPSIIRMERIRWHQYAGSTIPVLQHAEAVAVSVFSYQFFCSNAEVQVLDSGYDENAGTGYVTVEGPVGPEFEKQVLIPEPLMSVMAACETICVSSCCGPDAFEMDAARIREWAEKEGEAGALAEASHQLEELIKALPPSGGDYLSRQLGFRGSGNEWIEMLGQWKEVIKEAEGQR